VPTITCRRLCDEASTFVLGGHGLGHPGDEAGAWGEQMPQRQLVADIAEGLGDSLVIDAHRPQIVGDYDGPPMPSPSPMLPAALGEDHEAGCPRRVVIPGRPLGRCRTRRSDGRGQAAQGLGIAGLQLGIGIGDNACASS